MKKLLISILCIFCLLAVSSEASAQTKWRGQSINDYYRYFGPDLDIQLGAGYHWDTANKLRSNDFEMTRFRVGAMYVPNYPWVLSFGATSEIHSGPSVVWGGQAEALHIGSGFWLRSGGGLDYEARPHFNAALGWSFFGAEVNTFSAGPYDNREGVAVLATVRIPVGFIMYVLHLL